MPGHTTLSLGVHDTGTTRLFQPCIVEYGLDRGEIADLIGCRTLCDVIDTVVLGMDLCEFHPPNMSLRCSTDTSIATVDAPLSIGCAKSVEASRVVPVCGHHNNIQEFERQQAQSSPQRLHHEFKDPNKPKFSRISDTYWLTYIGSDNPMWQYGLNQ